MRLQTWYADVDASRRIAAAQLAVWFAGAGPVVGLAFAFAQLALGHPAERDRLTVAPAQLIVGGIWVGACTVSGQLIGARHAAGIPLGVALFVVVIAVSVIQRRPLSVATAYAVVGLLLLARARRATASGTRATAV